MPDTADYKQNFNFLIRAGLVFLLVVWCYEIIKPFVIPLVWGGIIAIAVYPLFVKLSGLSGQRPVLSSVLISLGLLSLLIVPMVLLTSSSIEIAGYLATELKSGKIQLPHLQPLLGKVPLIGQWLQDFIVTEDIETILGYFAPLLKTLGQQLLSFSAGVGSLLIHSLIAIVVAGFFLLKADQLGNCSIKLSSKLADEKGRMLNLLAVKTIMNVTQGIVGVAVLQAVLSGTGMLLADVPGAGIWTLLILILATIQLPPMLILLPVAIYLFYVSSLFVAISFLVLSIAISIIDAPIRAFLMSRDSRIPMLVIMIGAIGGMLAFGIIGLFVGAVVLAVGYELFNSWLQDNDSAK